LLQRRTHAHFGIFASGSSRTRNRHVDCGRLCELKYFGSAAGHCGTREFAHTKETKHLKSPSPLAMGGVVALGGFEEEPNTSKGM
jgi:hypothetical protein